MTTSCLPCKVPELLEGVFRWPGLGPGVHNVQCQLTFLAERDSWLVRSLVEATSSFSFCSRVACVIFPEDSSIRSLATFDGVNGQEY